jgi:Tat protein secretion system quality control protein TatD with DNase activity
VRLIAEKIAELRMEPLEKVAAHTEHAAHEFFKLARF